jgi:hypothetical protein
LLWLFDLFMLVNTVEFMENRKEGWGYNLEY